MKTFCTFILGLLTGWFMKSLLKPADREGRYAASEAEPAIYPAPTGRAPSVAAVRSRPRSRAGSDDLKIIKGIGPVIERRLNEAGIYTFEQLGNLTPADLRGILGRMIQRLADEEALLQQARSLARGGQAR